VEIQDITSVLDQLTPTRDSFDIMDQFAYSSAAELIQERTDLFGFFLGVLLGDSSKPLKGASRFPSRTVSLTLSQAKPNSYRFGEFMSLSTNVSLALRMHRIEDAEPSEHRYTNAGCYRWLTPASPLVSWAFRVGLGLNEGERTTYDPLRMNWLLKMPKRFQIHFLQGVTESDGCVNAGGDRVAFVSSPNEKLLMDLMSSLDIPCRLQKQPPITRIEFQTELGLPIPIFNERIHSNNYDDLVVMATAKRFPPRVALPDWFLTQIRPILSKKTKHSEACLEIAKTTGYKITDATVKKYRKALID
jgi:hypothetical protein